MYTRSLVLPPKPQKSFFLWGPRQSGKSSLLKKTYPDAYFVDLLKSENYLDYSTQPWLLRERVLKAKPPLVIVDEVQKIPLLLNEIHWLIEETNTQFILCGSSARQLRRKGTNLLGGRAHKYELSGLCSVELSKDFDLNRVLNHGYLPAIYQEDNPYPSLKSYVSDYLKEEILAEGLLRKLPPFVRFLELAALSDTELVSFESFARDTGVKGPTIKSYYEILCDTLIGSFLPAYNFKNKRKTIKSPKFYFFDVGIVNQLANRRNISAGNELFGKAFENFIYHELKCYMSYKSKDTFLSYWAIPKQCEVDFIVGHMDCAIEVKGSKKIQSDHLKGLKELKKEYPKLKRQIVVSLEIESRLNKDIEIYNYQDFLSKLWNDEIF